jgi:hypothetical protein
MRMREYDEIKAISNSMLKHFKRSPEHYIYELINKTPPTPAMIFGTAVHSYVLEPQNFFRDFSVMDESLKPVPDKDYRTKENKIWKDTFIAESEAAGKEMITVEQFDVIKRMNDKLRTNPQSKELIEFTRNEYEKTIRWNWKKSSCKGLMDISNEVFLADLKTTTDADPAEFHYHFFKLQYDRQAGMYSDGDTNGHFNFNNPKDFFFIAIESEAPHGISVHKVRAEVLRKGVEEYRDLTEKLQMCMDTKTFEGYEFKALISNRGQFEISLPAWAKGD